MNVYNGRVVYQGQKIYVNNTTYNATFTDVEFEIITIGTSTIVLPTIDSISKCAYHIWVKSGTCQITGTVDGTVNPLLTAQELEYDIICDGTQYFTNQTEKGGYEVATKVKTSTIQNYSQAGVIAINTVLMTIDCADANSISISCLAMGTTGVVTPRWRNAVGETGQGASVVTPAGASVTTFNVAGMWTTPVFARYLDLVLTTATTAGTTTITATKLYGQTPVQISPPAGTQAISGTVTAASTQGASAHSAALSTAPVYTAGKTLPTTTATVDTTLVAGDAAGLPVTTGQQLAIKQFGTAELDFTSYYTTAVTNVTPTICAVGSGVANVRNYIAGLTIQSDTLGAAGMAYLLDGQLTISSIATTTGLVTCTIHDLKVGDAVIFSSLAGGTGVNTGQVYYVTSVGSTTTFNFSATIGGSNVVPSVAYTGTNCFRVLYPIRFQTTAINTPVAITFPTPLRSYSNVSNYFYIPTSLTSGNIYLTTNGYRGF